MTETVAVTSETTGILKPEESVAEAIQKQYREEVGLDYTTDEEHSRVRMLRAPDYRATTADSVLIEKADRDMQLRQKYGIIPPQLTHTELRVIRKEERRGRHS